jgi:hypothetical protein
MRETSAQLEVASAQTGADKRRGSRLAREIHIVVSGADALGQPFRESVKTTSISCFGCKYPSKIYVPKGSTLTLEIPGHALRPSTRLMHGRVIWVQRPRNYREFYQVAVELEVPGNVWGISTPPESWFPHPDDEKPAVNGSEQIAAPGSAAVPSPSTVPSPLTAVLPATMAVAEEVVFTREHLDGEIEEAIARTVRTIAERIAGAAVEKVVQEATERATTAINKARESGRMAAEDLDAKIRQVLDEALAERSVGPPHKRATRRRRRPPAQ